MYQLRNFRTDNQQKLVAGEREPYTGSFGQKRHLELKFSLILQSSIKVGSGGYCAVTKGVG